MNCDIGRLRDKLEIVEEKVIINEYGFEEKTYHTIMTLYCYRVPVSTREFFGAEANKTTLKYKFICRKKTINPLNHILYKGDLYNIKHIHENISNSLIEILAEKRVQ